MDDASQSPAPIIKVANLFLSQEESPTYEMMAELDSSYIILDYATCTSKFWAVLTWAEQEQAKFMDYNYIRYQDRVIGKWLYYPDYYRSMAVRLYNFNGEAITDESPCNHV